MKKLALENKAAAVMIECIQGEGGVLTMEPGFVKGVAELFSQQAKEK